MTRGSLQAPPELATEQVEAQLRRVQRWSRPRGWGRPRPPRHPEWQIVERTGAGSPSRRPSGLALACAMAAAFNAACLWSLAIISLPVTATPTDNGVQLVVPPASGNVDLSLLPVDIRSPTGDQQAWEHLDQATGKVTTHPSPLAIPATIEDFVGNPLAIKPTSGGDTLMGGQRGMASRGDGHSGAKIQGIRARGEQFVFVMDNSLAMLGAAWQQARREALAGVSRLDRSQQFAVILCSGETYPAPGAAGDAEIHWHRGGQGAAPLLAQWLDLQVLAQDPESLLAIQAALQHRGDGLYLIGGPSFLDSLSEPVRKANRWIDEDRIKVPGSIIHAISIGPDARSALALQRIATENGGHYFHLAVPEG